MPLTSCPGVAKSSLYPFMYHCPLNSINWDLSSMLHDCLVKLVHVLCVIKVYSVQHTCSRQEQGTIGVASTGNNLKAWDWMQYRDKLI